MRKWLALALAVACALGMIGCNQNGQVYPSYQEPNFTEKVTISGETYSDVDGISIQVSGIYIYPDKTEIVVNWQNRTAYSAAYGESYWIERLENGEWVSCSLKDNAFDAVTYELRPNESDSIAYILTGMYEVNGSGTYRLLSACSVDMGEGKATECSVWAEFILE